VKIELTPDLEKMVREKVDAGLYDAPVDVVADALMLLDGQQRLAQRKLARLRRAIAKGEEDVRAGRLTVLETREDIEAFFRDL
jgi:antitoxin ParD1/3/4